jgi:hypothetical protein
MFILIQFLTLNSVAFVHQPFLSISHILLVQVISAVRHWGVVLRVVMAGIIASVA